MEPLFNFLGNYWWLVFVFGGMAGGWAKSISKANERRHRRKVELYKLKNQQVVAEQASQAEVAVLMAAHDAVNHKWLDYELDVGKLIDYPLMSDVREPLTVAFLRAKKEADGLRPAAAADITTAARLAGYRSAVRSYEIAFEIAEHEAKRIKDANFTGPERDRLATARKLLRIAEDVAATPAERQTAYKRARKELDGLIVLPDVTLAALEAKVAGMIDARRDPEADAQMA
ncbi:hypothetical protein IG195_02890 [Arthrobacter sp. TES]|uniref:hypothetical protein n=1 Tax=Paenarthrobacter ureafaciens TaxID=37931 RepID=UPI0003976249|nr:hypothetical protein [Paenarthrobacter ureafaciens]AOY72391.1 hypothetical protein ARZXY2_2866 [Arthrobacter sp. ZXY-2]ERI37309.1 hypothetical protein M707_12030 [Arthrobacter sp. AK-YN10]QOI64071.1 hypothetical protein IG195_02890 [Arthrobacter sp. TES]GLU59294.1 hypothetical protein Pure01_18070 [Paenarthrobacter ureafaciens]GLU63562.1 hypothetical protein Pure02_18120 [Paenarthrobacter ureafaciens]